MILKKNFNPLAVAKYLQTELLISTLFAVAVYFLYAFGHIQKVVIPFAVVGILGSALAIFLAFRNNSSYGRWWEARTTWGGIVNSSRIFARQLIANTEAALHTGKANAEAVQAYQTEMLNRQIAFAHALRQQLRGQNMPEEYAHLLKPDELQQALQSINVANYLMLQQGRRIKQGMHAELLGAFDNISLEPTVASFSHHQGACERIKHTPLLRQYHYFIRLFLWVFMAMLPFALIADFTRMEVPWLVIPISILISFVFGVMGRVGQVNEDPFENKITDLPLTAMCNTIERDLKEMLGQPIPEQRVPQNGYLM
ncbi:MAG TPA: bestrophin family ion channel [Phnomibacter sp.]|nr:bestrophin family ion channel [Phnomibacter sp.]